MYGFQTRGLAALRTLEVYVIMLVSMRLLVAHIVTQGVFYTALVV